VGDPAGARLRPGPLGLHPETLGEFISSEQPVHALSPGGRRRQADLGDPRQPRGSARPDSASVTRPRAAVRAMASLGVSMMA
jgi:hypothetical protein